MSRKIAVLVSVLLFAVISSSAVSAQRIPADFTIDYYGVNEKLKAGERVYDYITIRNSGGSPAQIPAGMVLARTDFEGFTSDYCRSHSSNGPYRCNVTDSAVELVATEADTIAAGGTRGLSVEFVAPEQDGRASTSVTADPGGSVEEANEQNNFIKKRVSYVGQVLPTNVSVTQVDSRDPIQLEWEDYLAYTITVENKGDDTAFDVVVQVTLPAAFDEDESLGSYGESGQCNELDNGSLYVICTFDRIPSGESREIEVWGYLESGTEAGVIENKVEAFVDGNGEPNVDDGDPDLSNNTSVEKTTIAPPPDYDPPVVELTETPEPATRNNVAIFEYTANETATFECRPNTSSEFSSCSSPAVYRDLDDGNYEFSVRATDESGNVGSSESYSWTVDNAAPVVTGFSPKAGASTKDRTPRISAIVQDATMWEQGATYTMHLDGRTVVNRVMSGNTATTGSPLTFTPGKALKPGKHTVKVYAKDGAGNSVTRQWTFKVLR